MKLFKKRYKITSKKSKESFIGFFRFRRLRILWRKWTKSLDKTISLPAKEKLNSREEKAMKLWKTSLKDTDLKMSFSSIGDRQIETLDLYIILSPIGTMDYIMTVMPSKLNERNLYEFRFSGKIADLICESFDIEMQKRMNKVESAKISLIEEDLDKLIEKAESKLKLKSESK